MRRRDAGSARPSAADVAPLQEASLRIARRLRRHSGADLTLSQLSALSTLQRNGPMRVGELAQRESISRSSVTRLVARLAELQYLNREMDSEDGRSSIISISSDGHARLEAAKDRANKFLVGEVDRLTAVDRQALLAALPALERLVALPQSRSNEQDLRPV